ncbi:hypothetical protein AG1IA_01862 [Rhizoctonia solani AG-1 IA]|uniref:Uncharacterized protein n=1 Tax=Thanatephorus cucumeris (strain AG1-IA) TaxID=983506 RepID=L8X4R6_THACA|nr:hypothetical protein AG1IA_01862 [Rhizoctonia solani AG-1 IA]
MQAESRNGSTTALFVGIVDSADKGTKNAPQRLLWSGGGNKISQDTKLLQGMLPDARPREGKFAPYKHGVRHEITRQTSANTDKYKVFPFILKIAAAALFTFRLPTTSSLSQAAEPFATSNMRFTICALTLSALSAVSAITITKPDSSGWKNGTVTSCTNQYGMDQCIGRPISLHHPAARHKHSLSNQPNGYWCVNGPFPPDSWLILCAAANNVQTAAGTASFELPIVPQVQTYVIEFVNISDINQVYASSTTFPVVDVPQSASASVTATTPSATSATSTITTSTVSSSSSTAAPASTSPVTNGALGLQAPAVIAGLLAMLAFNRGQRNCSVQLHLSRVGDYVIIYVATATRFPDEHRANYCYRVLAGAFTCALLARAVLISSTWAQRTRDCLGNEDLQANTSDTLFLAALLSFETSLCHPRCRSAVYNSLDRANLNSSSSTMISTLVILLLSFIYVQALVITQPDATGWPRNSGFMTVRWTTSPSDPPLRTFPRPRDHSSSTFPPYQYPSVLNGRQTYQLLFVDSTNLTRVGPGHINNLTYIPHHQFPTNNLRLVLFRNYHPKDSHRYIICTTIDISTRFINDLGNTNCQQHPINAHVHNSVYHEHLGNNTTGNCYRDSYSRSGVVVCSYKFRRTTRVDVWMGWAVRCVLSSSVEGVDARFMRDEAGFVVVLRFIPGPSAYCIVLGLEAAKRNKKYRSLENLFAYPIVH